MTAHVAVVREPRVCALPDCGSTFTPPTKRSTFCSLKCRWSDSNRRRLGHAPDGSFPDRECASTECGATFAPARSNQQYCSPRCAQRSSYTSRVASGTLVRTEMTPERIEAARNRTMLQQVRKRIADAGFGAEVDPTVTLTAVIERDGNVCQLKCAVGPVADRGVAVHVRPDYPTIDHKLPINAGGGHTWDNVQLAHRCCNRDKWDDVCKSCDGALDDPSEPVCAKCADKGRSVRVRYGVCAHCGYVELPGGFCSRCKAKGAGLWVRDDLTLKAALDLSRRMGFEPKGLSIRPTTEWVMWAA